MSSSLSFGSCILFSFFRGITVSTVLACSVIELRGALTRSLVVPFAAVPSPPTGPLEVVPAGAHAVVIEWGAPESDGGAPLEGYDIALRDARRTMWMQVGQVRADQQRLIVKDLQVRIHAFLKGIGERRENRRLIVVGESRFRANKSAVRSDVGIVAWVKFCSSNYGV